MKLGADAFLYLNPEPNTEEFAQCCTCRDWVTDDNRCFIHGPHVNVPGSASCGLYVWGAPLPAGSKTVGIVTATESGLVDRDVRCENCVYGGPEVYTCSLFDMLNDELPNIFDIDTSIEPKGCCNAQTPRT